MSILIKGVEMPTNCRACMFSRTDIRNVDWCVLTEKDLPCDCPIVHLPEHGRLIDADELVHAYYHAPSFPNLCKAINEAPTIIPADKEVEG